MSRRKGDKNKKPLTSRRLRYEYLRLTRLYDDIGPRASAANLKTERSRAKKEGIAEARRIVAEAEASGEPIERVWLRCLHIHEQLATSGCRAPTGRIHFYSTNSPA
jgi:hypothetical protein